MFRSVHVDVIVDAVVVLLRGRVEMPAVLAVVELAIFPGEDDGVVAGTGSREGPKYPTMAVTPGRFVAD